MSKSLASLTSFVLLAVLASPALAQTPTVSLLIDHGYPSSGTLNIKSVLNDVSTRKGQTFHFGSTYDTYDSNAAWTSNIFTTFFNHIVAENGCKWDATEPTRGTSSLSGCIGVQTFATQHSDTFRGHNLFWHSQTPVCMPSRDLLLICTYTSMSVLASRRYLSQRPGRQCHSPACHAGSHWSRR